MGDQGERKGDFDGEDNASEDDAFEGESSSSKGINAIILVDVNRWMWGPFSQTEDYLHIALCILRDLLKESIPLSQSHNIGVCFYGSKYTDNPFNFDGIVVSFPPTPPSIENLKQVEQLIQSKPANLDGVEYFDYALEPSMQTVSLESAFHVCDYYLSNTHDRSNVIYIFTNNDEPYGSDVEGKERCIKQAEELRQKDVQINVLPIRSEGHEPFNLDKFYKGISSEPLANDETVDLLNETDKLVSLFKDFDISRKHMTVLPWVITPEVQIPVKVYHLYRKLPNPLRKRVRRDDSQPVRSITFQCTEREFEKVHSSQTQRFHQAGQYIAIFTDEEIKQMRSISTPGFKLMGFKPREYLKDWMNVQPSLFIYPDEKKAAGSETAFIALHKRMIERGVIGVCLATMRSAQYPRYAAFLPSTDPSGIHVIFLPFANDVRNLAQEKIVAPDAESRRHVDAADKLVKKLTLKSFHPSDFPNPDVKRHSEVMCAIATKNFEDANQRPWKDNVKALEFEPGTDHHNVVANLINTVWPTGAPLVESSTKKRNDQERTAAKRVKKEEENDEILSLDWEKMVKDKTVEKRTVVELKSFLSSRGVRIPPNSVKRDLVGLVTKEFQ